MRCTPPRVANIGCLLRVAVSGGQQQQQQQQQQLQQQQQPNCMIQSAAASALPASAVAAPAGSVHKVVTLRAIKKGEELTLGRIKAAHYPLF